MLSYLLPIFMYLLPLTPLCLVNGYIPPEYIAVFCLLILLNLYGIYEGYTSWRYLIFFGLLTLNIYGVRGGYISWKQSIPIATLVLGMLLYTSDSKRLVLSPLKTNGSKEIVINTLLSFLSILQRVRNVFRREVVNVIYRKIGDRRYAEVQINDGSRKGKIYIPLIPTTCEVNASGSDVSIDVPYTTFQSNGCIWSVPIRPYTVGCKQLKININNREDKIYDFTFDEKDMVDLSDVIEQHKQGSTLDDSTDTGLADAYD
jgi:hypothetical protein